MPVQAAAREFPISSVSPPAPSRADEAPRLDQATGAAPGAQTYQAALHALPTPVVLIGLDGAFVDLNAAAAAITGRTREELVGQTWAAITYPDDIPACQAAAEALLRGEVDELEREKRFLRPDGSAVWCSVHLAVVRDAAGEAEAFVGRIADLSATRAAAAALHDAQQRFRAAFEDAPIGASVMTPEGRYLEVNRTLCEMLGRTREELLATTWRALTHPDDLAADDAAVAAAKASGSPRISLEKRFLRPDGSPVWTRVNATILRDAAGVETGAVVQVEDVTDRIQAQDFLREVEERLQAGFRGAATGMAISDLEGNWLDVNDALCALLGRSRDEMLACAWHQLTHPDDVEPGRRRAAELVAAGRGTYAIDKRFLRPDASVVWASVSVSLVNGEGLRPPYFVAQIQDVTARREAEQALADSEARFRAMFERAPIGMAMIDEQGRHVAANETLCQMLGYTREELADLSWQELTPPDDLVAELAEGGPGALALSDTGNRWEKRYRRRDGSLIWVDLASYRVPARASGASYNFSQYLDITERRRVEEALRVSEQRLRTIFESAPIGMALYTPEGTLVAANPALSAMTGLSYDQLATQLLSDLTHPDDVEREREALSSLLGREVDRVTYERRIRHRSGDDVPVETSSTLIRTDDGNPVYVLVQQTDIGERRRLERQLQQASKLEAIGRLAGGVAHDFNNMLLVVRGYTHLLLQRLPEGDPARAEAIEIDLAAERAARLVGQLLAFGRRQLLQPRVLDLNEVVRHSESLARRLVDESVVLRVDLSPSLETVRADQGQLEQAIINLVINARDALTGGGTVTISTSVMRLGTLAATEAGVAPGRYAVLTVEDDGIGMDAETAARAFEPFFTTKAVGTGTGLGLATVHGIVTQSGGGVAIESTIGRGTAVSLYLPLAAAGSAVELETVDLPPLPAADAVPARGERIVVVEDDVESRALVARVLAASGYHVSSFASPVDALDWLDAAPQQVDALVSDVVMPGMRGPELARRVLARCPAAEVVLMSGFVDGDMTDDLAALGMRFLAKPFTPAELLELLAAALDGKGAPAGPAGSRGDR